MSKKQKNALVWFHNNLRITDNKALSDAVIENDRVLGLFCFDPRWFLPSNYGFKKMEKFRARFLIESVKQLKEALADKNITLIIAFEIAEKMIPEIINEHQISTVYFQKEWTDEESMIVDKVITSSLKHVTFKSYYDQFLFHPDDLPFEPAEVPNVFTVFRKRIEKNVAVRKLPEAIPRMPETNIQKTATGKIPELSDLGFSDFETDRRSAFPFLGGEKEALVRLKNYFFNTKKLGFYKKTRNGLLGVDYSSKFSPWLANGCLSPRMIYWNVKRFESEHYKNESTYWLIFELIWRDYFKYISLKYGNQIFMKTGILRKTRVWKNEIENIRKWIDGDTISPFVNANMIELRETGWMSNRGRQNVASFFTKDLQLDWRIGAAYFEAMLLDYDVHSNYGNWMYVSGVGNDPRDRKFNVALQAKQYDPKGKYQQSWLQKTLF